MIEITRLATKVIANLRSHDSAKYTKLAKNLLKISELSKEIKELETTTKAETKELIADLFDEAEDITKTRVVNTISFTFELSKNPKPTNTTKYAEVLKELEEHLTPELIEKLNELKEKYSSTTQRSPSIKVEPVQESLVPNWMKNIYSWIKSLKIWGKNYDEKLQNLEKISLKYNLI